MPVGVWLEEEFPERMSMGWGVLRVKGCCSIQRVAIGGS